MLAAGLYFQQPNSLKMFTSDDVSFRYAAAYNPRVARPAPAEDSQNVVTLTRDNPSGYISVDKAASAKTAADLLKVSQLEFLEKNAELKFKTAYKDYKRSSLERLSLAGYDAEVITFSYIGNDSKTTVYTKYIVIPTNEAIYYINAQSPDRSQLDEDAAAVMDSIKITL